MKGNSTCVICNITILDILVISFSRYVLIYILKFFKNIFKEFFSSTLYTHIYAHTRILIIFI